MSDDEDEAPMNPRVMFDILENPPVPVPTPGIQAASRWLTDMAAEQAQEGKISEQMMRDLCEIAKTGYEGGQEPEMYRRLKHGLMHMAHQTSELAVKFMDQRRELAAARVAKVEAEEAAVKVALEKSEQNVNFLACITTNTLVQVEVKDSLTKRFGHSMANHYVSETRKAEKRVKRRIASELDNERVSKRTRSSAVPATSTMHQRLMARAELRRILPSMDQGNEE